MKILKISLRSFILFGLIALLFINAQAGAFEFKKQTTGEKEIIKFIKDYNKVLKKDDFETIRKFYNVNYKNSDGYDLEELISMMDKTSKAFKDIKYNTKIERIDIRNNNAVVHLSDKTKAKMFPSLEPKNKEKAGTLYGESTSLMCLQKNESGQWEIIQDSVLEEVTSLKYGIAKRIKMDLITPQTIQNAQDYDITLNVANKRNIVALASLSREEVNTDQKAQEAFRRVSEEGTLQRLVKANSNNKDEYAIASVGFAKVTIYKKAKKAKIQILGIAYIMKRIPLKNNDLVVNEVSSIDKTGNN